MNDGADNTHCGAEPMVVEVQSADAGREVASSALCSSAVNTPSLDQNAEDEGITEHRAYIDAQIRNDWEDLDLKDRAFCTEYLENGYDHLSAAKEAGFARSGGKRLIQKPLVREYILWKERQLESRSLVTRQFIDAKLLETLDEASGEVEVALVDKDGVQFQAKKYNGQLKLSVLQEMGKVSGISKPDVLEGAGGVQVIIDVAGLLGREKPNKVVSEQ